MKELFDELVIDGEAAVRRLIAERRQEAVDLEFKTKSNPNTGLLNDDDRRVLGKALSAFSNSMGGVILYGVHTSENDGIDCASDPQPIDDIERFKNEVIRAAGQLLMPRHDGVRIEHIPAANPPGSGYLAIYIERSERRPHRSEVRGDKQYYKRAGESSFAMEHYDIEDMFRRRTVPVVEVEWRLEEREHEFPLLVAISVRNTSTVTARFFYLHVERGNFFPLNPGPRDIELPERGDPSWYFFDSGANDVINPGVVRSVTKIVVQARRHQTNRARLEMAAPLQIRYACGCEHSPIRHGVITISAEDIDALFA